MLCSIIVLLLSTVSVPVTAVEPHQSPCPKGFIPLKSVAPQVTRCYLFGEKNLPYDEAADFCNRSSSTLVKPDYSRQFDALKWYIENNTTTGFYWLAAKHTLSEGWRMDPVQGSERFDFEKEVNLTCEDNKSCCLILYQTGWMLNHCTLVMLPLCRWDDKKRVQHQVPIVTKTVKDCQHALTTTGLRGDHVDRLERSYDALRYLLETYDTRTEVRAAMYVSIMSLMVSGIAIGILFLMLRKSWKRRGSKSFATANKGNNPVRVRVMDGSKTPTVVPSLCCICS